MQEKINDLPLFDSKAQNALRKFLASCLFVAIMCNNLFRLWFNWQPNYFYLHNYKGTPLKFFMCFK